MGTLTLQLKVWLLLGALLASAVTPGAALCRCAGHAEGACLGSAFACRRDATAPATAPSCCGGGAPATPDRAVGGMSPACPCGETTSLAEFVPALSAGVPAPEGADPLPVASRAMRPRAVYARSAPCAPRGIGPPGQTPGASIAILRI